ncbi:MAG TPA: hypothetical protein VNC84_04035 [Gammaproteobacteria bacterium]|jgi:hypothetical protein|nr:hypothetical protein [Gammaproteobacteria bacterium]
MKFQFIKKEGGIEEFDTVYPVAWLKLEPHYLNSLLEQETQPISFAAAQRVFDECKLHAEAHCRFGSDVIRDAPSSRTATTYRYLVNTGLSGDDDYNVMRQIMDKLAPGETPLAIAQRIRSAPGSSPKRSSLARIRETLGKLDDTKEAPFLKKSPSGISRGRAVIPYRSTYTSGQRRRIPDVPNQEKAIHDTVEALQDYGLTERYLRKNIQSPFLYCGVQKHILIYLVTGRHPIEQCASLILPEEIRLTPAQAMSEIEDLNAPMIQVLEEYYIHGLRGVHLREFQTLTAKPFSYDDILTFKDFERERKSGLSVEKIISDMIVEQKNHAELTQGSSSDGSDVDRLVAMIEEYSSVASRLS